MCAALPGREAAGEVGDEPEPVGQSGLIDRLLVAAPPHGQPARSPLSAPMRPSTGGQNAGKAPVDLAFVV